MSLISNNEYKHVWKVWNSFKCECVLNDTQLYNKGDILVLADETTNFRNKSCLKTYSLYPSSMVLHTSL